jgi:hypothetical protein
MRSSNLLTKSLLALGIVCASCVPAFADKSDDLYARGTAAVNAGDPIAARDAFCAIDAGYKDAAMQCTTYKAEATRALNRFNQNFLEGVQLMQEGKLDQAEFKFRNVKAGERVELAKRKLQEIQDLRQKNAAAAQAAAQQSSQYEARMAEAGRYAAAKDYERAAAAYDEAARINPGGAGNPSGQAANMRQLAAAATSAATTKPPVAPVKKERQRIDESEYIATAKRFIGKNDFAKARRYLNEVNAQNDRNEEAISLLKSLPQEEKTTTSAGEEDKALSRALEDFYSGKLVDAERRLNTYRDTNGNKKGLGSFYLGVVVLTKYCFLAANPDANQRTFAIQLFKEAAAVNGFVVPEKYVSPKIMKVYYEAVPEAKPAS